MKLLILTVLFSAFAWGQTAPMVIRDNFNRATTPDVATSPPAPKKWLQPINHQTPSSVKINSDSTATFSGGTRGAEVWDTAFTSRLKVSVVLKNRVMPTGGATPQDESMFFYFLNTKDFANCTGYAVIVTDANFGSKWSRIDIYKITGNAVTGTVINTGYDTLTVGDTLMFGVDHFNNTFTFYNNHSPNYGYPNKHFQLSVQDFTYDLFGTSFYVWIRGCDYQNVYGVGDWKFDDFSIGADPPMTVPALASPPKITYWGLLPGGGVDSLTPFRWQISAVDTFRVNKIVIVQNGVRTDSFWSGNGLSPSRRSVRWTSNPTTVTRSGLNFTGYALVYDDSGKVKSSDTTTFTTISRSYPWVLGYFPWYYENVYLPTAVPWKYVTHVVDFEAFVRGTFNGVTVRTDTAPYFYWEYRLDTSFNHKPWRDSLIAIGHRQVPRVPVLAGYAYYHQWEIFSQGDSVIKIWAHNLSDTLKKYGYDGLDLDLEPYPDDAVQAQWFSVIKILRDTLDKWTPRKGILTCAPSQFNKNPGISYGYPDNLELCDRIDVQEYDQGGYWNSGTAYNSPLFPPDTSLPGWHGYNGGSDSSGIASWVGQLHYKSRIMFGIPFYGRTFHGVNAPNSTPNNNYNAVLYDSVINYQLTNVNSTRIFDNKTKVPYVTNPTQNYWTTYEDTVSVKLKGEYAIKAGLGGVMIFSLGDGALRTVPAGHRQNELAEALFNKVMSLAGRDTMRSIFYGFPYVNPHVQSQAGLKDRPDLSNTGENNFVARVDSILHVIDSAAHGGFGVLSVFGRVGNIIAQTGDYSFLQLAGVLQTSQFPALTGDVTTPSGSVFTTIQANAVGNTKLAQAPANTLKGNITGSLANETDLTKAQVQTWLDSVRASRLSDSTKKVAAGGIVGTIPFADSARADHISDSAKAVAAANIKGLIAYADSVRAARIADSTKKNAPITLSGDVAGSGNSAIATTIQPNAVTNAKMATMPDKTVKGNVSGGTAVPVDLTKGQLQTLIDSLRAALIADSTKKNVVMTFTNHVTGSGNTTVSLTIASNVVANSMLAQAPANTMKGNNTGGTANELDLTKTQVQNFIDSLRASLISDSTKKNVSMTFTGDVTGSGALNVTLTIATNAVTNSKLAQMPANTVKANITGSTANAQDITKAQLQAFIDSVRGSAISDSSRKLNASGLSGTISPLRMGDNISPPDTSKILLGSNHWVTIKDWHLSIDPASDTITVSDSWVQPGVILHVMSNFVYFGTNALSNMGSPIVEIMPGVFRITWAFQQPVGTKIAVSMIGRN